jgi:hypothetical protein
MQTDLPEPDIRTAAKGLTESIAENLIICLNSKLLAEFRHQGPVVGRVR